MISFLSALVVIGTGVVVTLLGFRLCRWSTTLQSGIARWVFAHIGFVMLLGFGLGPIIFGVVYSVFTLSADR